MLAKIQIESQNFINSANQIQATSIGEGREIKESGGVRLRRLFWRSVHRKSPLNSRERELRRGPREGGEGGRPQDEVDGVVAACLVDPLKGPLKQKAAPPFSRLILI